MPACNFDVVILGGGNAGMGVTVALRDLEGHGRCLGPDGSRASAVVDRCGGAEAGYVAAPASLFALANSRQR